MQFLHIRTVHTITTAEQHSSASEQSHAQPDNAIFLLVAAAAATVSHCYNWPLCTSTTTLDWASNFDK